MRFKLIKIPNFCLKALIVTLISFASSVCFGGSAQTAISKALKFQAGGKYVEAIAEFYNGVIKDPSYPYTYNHLAVISDIVLDDYDAAAIFYEKALSLLEFRKVFLDKGLISINPAEGKAFNNAELFDSDKLNAAINDIKEKKAKLIKKMYDAIDSPIYPVYIAIKKKKKIYTGPGSTGKPIPPDSLAGQKEFMFLELQDNWYKVQLPSSNEGWIKSKDINLIYRNKAKPIMLSKAEKAKVYKEFSVNFQNNVLAEKAKAISDKLTVETGGSIRAAKEPQHANIAKSAQPAANENLSPDDKEQRIMVKLEKLKDFYKKGLIDQEEYEAKKKDILKEL